MKPDVCIQASCCMRTRYMPGSMMQILQSSIRGKDDFVCIACIERNAQALSFLQVQQSRIVVGMCHVSHMMQIMQSSISGKDDFVCITCFERNARALSFSECSKVRWLLECDMYHICLLDCQKQQPVHIFSIKLLSKALSACMCVCVGVCVQTGLHVQCSIAK
jgi:hypothetical protein